MLDVGQAFDGTAIVEGVAQAHHGLRLKDVDQNRQHRQRLARIVSRQQLARSDGVGGSLLQVKVGHRQQAPGRPVQGAGRQGLQFLAGTIELERDHARHD